MAHVELPADDPEDLARFVRAHPVGAGGIMSSGVRPSSMHGETHSGRMPAVLMMPA